MQIPTLYLIIAGQVALIMVFLIAFLIYMLVSEENRWEEYSNKLKSKIRDLQEHKDRLDIVSANLEKQTESSKELIDKTRDFEAQLAAKDKKIAEKDSFIELLQSTIGELQGIIKELEKKVQQLDASTQTIAELKTQLVLLEDQGTQFTAQINNLNAKIETLEADNTMLKLGV